jgi:hypothetical protein
MVFREQALTQLCRVCRAEGTCVCPSCGNVLCGMHRIQPNDLCEGCAVEMYLVVSKAGRTALTVGGAATTVILVGAQLLASFEMRPALTMGLVIGGILLGAATLSWGVWAPKRAERKAVRGFRNRKLPAPHGEGKDAHE